MDLLLPPGPVTYGIATNIIEDTVVVKKMSGKILLQGIENCVSMFPNLSGRFSVVSGISFTWDAQKKPYERILPETVTINE